MSHKISEISSLDSYDYANLCGNYLAILRDEKDHETLLKNRGYTEAQLQAVSGKSSVLVFKNLGLKYTIPLTNFEYENLGLVLTYFDYYEKGLLPFPGTVSEQPAQIIEIFSTIKTIRYEHQLYLDKAQQRPKSPRK